MVSVASLSCVELAFPSRELSLLLVPCSKTTSLCRSISSHPVVFSRVSPLSIGANKATMLCLSKIVAWPGGDEALDFGWARY
jgi:hypothetical protein